MEVYDYGHDKVFGKNTMKISKEYIDTLKKNSN